MPYTRVNDPEKLRRLMDAVLLLTAEVEIQDLLGHFIEEARALVGASYGALGVLNEAGTGLERFVTVGLSEKVERAIGARPTGRGVLGLLITNPEPVRLTNLVDDPHSFGFPPDHPAMTSFLGVPVRVRDEVYGNLYLTNKVGRETFSDEDEALAEALAVAAGIAIQNHRLHERVRIVSMLDDRDRIARDLHDRVIQRIFAVGMSLQGAARLPDATRMADRVSKAVDELDATIAEIRTTIFELGRAPAGGVRRSVLAVVAELTPTLGARPQVSFSGPVDTTVAEPVHEHLLAVLREGLTNASKHAGGSRVVVTVTVCDDRIDLEIIDDGLGFDPDTVRGGLGLGNLRRRAEKLGGTFAIEPAPDGGTRLRWSVPA